MGIFPTSVEHEGQRFMNTVQRPRFQKPGLFVHVQAFKYEAQYDKSHVYMIFSFSSL